MATDWATLISEPHVAHMPLFEYPTSVTQLYLYFGQRLESFETSIKNSEVTHLWTDSVNFSF